MRSAKDFFRPKAIGAPMPLREIPFRPARSATPRLVPEADDDGRPLRVALLAGAVGSRRQHCLADLVAHGRDRQVGRPVSPPDRPQRPPVSPGQHGEPPVRLGPAHRRRPRRHQGRVGPDAVQSQGAGEGLLARDEPLQGECVDHIARVVTVVERDNKRELLGHGPMVAQRPPPRLRISLAHGFASRKPAKAAPPASGVRGRRCGRLLRGAWEALVGPGQVGCAGGLIGRGGGGGELVGELLGDGAGQRGGQHRHVAGGHPQLAVGEQ